MKKMEEMEKDEVLPPRRRGGFLGKFIALLLGFVLGVVGGIGGLGYAGYYAATQLKIQDGVNYLNTYAGLNIDYTAYINGKYGEATIADLIGDLGGAVKEISEGNGSLNTLNEISPYVATLVLGEEGSQENTGLLGKLLDFGLELEGEALMDRLLVKPSGVTEKNPDVYFTDYLLDGVNSIEVVKILELAKIEVNDLLSLICYEGERAITIGELMTMDVFAKFSAIPLETVLKPQAGNAIMMHLSYGPSNRYDASGETVTMKPMYFTLTEEGGAVKALDDQGNAVKNSAISQVNGNTCVLTITNGEDVTTYYLSKDAESDKYFAYEDSAFTTQVSFPKVTLATLQGDGMDFIFTLALKDVLGVDESTTDTLMKALCFDENGNPTTIGTLSNQGSAFFNGLKLCDVLNVKSDTENSLLKSLCFDENGNPRTIEALKDAGFINTLKLCDILNVAITTDNSLLKSLCFDDAGNPRTIEALKDAGFINTLKLCDILNVKSDTENTLLKSLCFDENGNPRTVDDLKNTDLIESLKLCDVLNITRSSDNTLLKAICFDGDYDRTISDLKNGNLFESLKLCDVLNVTRSSEDALLKAICFDGDYDRTISDLKNGNLFESLKLCDVLNITRSSDNTLLKAICFDGDNDRTISDLKNGNLFESLKLCDVLNVTRSSGDTLLKSICFDGDYDRTISDLKNGNVFKNLKLCDALNIDSNTENTLLKAICFDENGDPRTIDDLKNDPDFINTLKLSEVLNVGKDTDNALMKALCFDGDHERTIEELKTGGTSFFDEIKLSDLLHVDHDSTLIMYLIYGKKGIHYDEAADGSIYMLQKRVAVYNNYVFDEYGDFQLTDTYTSGTYTINGVTYKTKVDATLGTVKVEIGGVEQTAQLYYVQDAEGNDVMFDAPTLGMLTAEDSPLLNNAMNHLTVADILGDAATDGNNLLSLIGHSPINKMADEVEKLRIVDVFEKDIYYTNDEGLFTDKEGNVLADQSLRLDENVQPTWKYLLKDENGNIDTDLTITEGMTTMMTNMTRNIQSASLKDLVEDGILKLEGQALIKYNTNPDAEMFTWTLPQAIDKMFVYMALVEKYQQQYPGLFN